MLQNSSARRRGIALDGQMIFQSVGSVGVQECASASNAKAQATRRGYNSGAAFFKVLII